MTEKTKNKEWIYTVMEDREKAKYLLGLFAKFEEDDLLLNFAAQFLNSMALRTLKIFKPAELEAFVKERFTFFQKALSNKQALSLNVSQVGVSWLNNKRILEFVCPDMPYLLLTFEAVLAQYENLQVTRKLYPIIGVNIDNQNKLLDFCQVSLGKRLYSYIYMEIEGVLDENKLNEIQEQLKHHMEAVNIVVNSKEDIKVKLIDLKEEIRGIDFPKEECGSEWKALIDWLNDDNFVFVGYMPFVYPADKDGQAKPLLKEGIGILGDEYLKKDTTNILDNLTSIVWNRRKRERPFIFEDVNIKSPVCKFEKLERLSFQIKEKDRIVEYNFLGLIKSSLYKKDIPLINLKLNYIFKARNVLPGTYDYHEILRVFESTPKLELFRVPADDLLKMIEDIFGITNPTDIYLFTRFMSESKKIQVMVVTPKAVITEENIKKITDYLVNKIPHTNYEIVQAIERERGRLHFYFDPLPDTPLPCGKDLREEIKALIEPWELRLKNELRRVYPGVLSEKFYKKYYDCFPVYYRARTPISTIVRNIKFLEKIQNEENFQFDLSNYDVPTSEFFEKVSLLSVYSKEKTDLDIIMPILHNMGVYVIDQFRAKIGKRGKNAAIGYIQNFRLIDEQGKKLDEAKSKCILCELLQKIFEGKTENDALNKLALMAGLDWRAINVFMTYRNFFAQIDLTYSKEIVNKALITYPQLTQILYKYFVTKFSLEQKYGSLDYRKTVLLPQIKKDFEDGLRDVAEVSYDVVFRKILNIMESTLRTNFYIKKEDVNETFISIKINSRNVKPMPLPVPYREIYVHDVGVEGVHLRFGAIARGGLRWSDRPYDFRSEVLGLVKTQQVKNVVIVPNGSKGGFVVKKTFAHKEEMFEEGKKQYKKFISGLLDVTDNVDKHGSVMHPKEVMIYDESDPYLVVAADKGTATFSDLANSISQKYGFWLGDAFASGGSYGYDHKKLAITARGAWECVKLHFKEKGIDVDKEVTTAIGIGDMAGDVFGNGLLRSKFVKLKAAFNHIHIFLDPDPDPAKSFAERKRLFELPHSSWKDYRPSLISNGGGVFDRQAKEIKLSKQVQEMLEVNTDVLTGEEVVKAILKMKVDFLWLGGIGTYIKGTEQTQAQVGDPANDRVRINASECRFSIIGEGANLGFTQLARMEFEDNEGACNTDAIDNSAGVNISDYEVNLKILMNYCLQNNILKSMEERNVLLAGLADECCELDLANNRGQHRVISMDQIRSEKNMADFRNLIMFYISRGKLDAKTEAIPSPKKMMQLEAEEKPLYRSVLSVIQAYVKMEISDSLIKSKLLNDKYLTKFYLQYFPKLVQEKFGEILDKHQLKKEIIATLLTNRIVNQAGSTFFYTLITETNRSIEDIVKVYLIFDACLGGKEYKGEILAESKVTYQDKYLALIEYEDALKRLCKVFLQLTDIEISFELIERYRDVFRSLRGSISLDDKETGEEIALWQEFGFSEKIAKDIASLVTLEMAPDIIFLHETKDVPVDQARSLVYGINKIFSLDILMKKLNLLELKTEWDTEYQNILMQSLEVFKLRMVSIILDKHKNKSRSIKSEEIISLVKAKKPHLLDNYFKALDKLKVNPKLDFTVLSVVISKLQYLEV